jgi:hypothetical protein
VKPVETYLEEYPLPEIPPNASDIFMEKYEDAKDLQDRILEHVQNTRDANAEGPVDFQTEYEQTEELDKLIKEYEQMLRDLDVELQLLRHEQPTYGPIPTPSIPYPGEIPEPAPPMPPAPWNPPPEFGPAPFVNKPPIERPPVATVGPSHGPINNESNPYSWNNTPGQTADVPSVDCGPGQFFDGRQCRASGGASGNLVNQAMNFGQSASAQAVSLNPSSDQLTYASMMSGRIRVENPELIG